MIAAVVLAAGLSRRMGRRKLMLEIDGKPILRWAVDGVVGAVDDTVVVAGPDDRAVREVLAGLRVRFAENPHPDEGQGTSIATGVAALAPGTEAALVVLGDQPWVPADVVPALIAAFRAGGTPIVAPTYRGTQGNPVLFARSLFDELSVLTGDAGARRIVQGDPARVARVSFDVDMPLDVDTPEDLARLVASRGPRVQ